ncbi:hypothetical protein [Micromonospora sp. NPDC005173]|uniref:hypothetical protein n=1 Tax=Micromonospora sp. NPDC005173 TaxID=3157165 RepID=UPI0033B9A590
MTGGQAPPAPYVTIAQELDAFANTNYPGIQPATRVEDARPLLLPKQKTAWSDMQTLTLLLGDYRQQNGSSGRHTTAVRHQLGTAGRGRPGVGGTSTATLFAGGDSTSLSAPALLIGDGNELAVCVLKS